MEMKKTIKSIFGYKNVTHDFELEDDYTHVIMDREYYLNNQNDYKEKIKKITDKANDYVDIINSERKMASEDNSNATKILNEVKKDLNNEIDKIKFDLVKEKSLNSNLLRILKERANAERNLKNKKTHTGYILLNVNQHNFIVSEKINREIIKKRFICWDNKIQTPYKISLDFSSFKVVLKDDFIEKIFPLLKIKSFVNIKDMRIYDESIAEFEKMHSSKEIFIFNLAINMNINKGFWEISFLSNNIINISDKILKYPIHKNF